MMTTTEDFWRWHKEKEETTPMKPNTVALLRLADKLEGKGPYEEVGPIPTKQFNMYIFVDMVNLKKEQFNETVKSIVVAPNLPCGTSACAAGWAGSDPWFRKRGFYTTANDSVRYAPKKKSWILSGFHAIEEFFQI